MLRRVCKQSFNLRRNISALYVTGDKATENCAVITPYLEIDERFGKNFEELKKNVEIRRLQIDLEYIKSEYELFKDVKQRKKELEERRKENARLVKENSNEGLIQQGKFLRDDLKELKENSYELEGNLMTNFLSLPNFLHDQTPRDEKKILYENQPAAHETTSSKTAELIEYYDSFCFYMKGLAAEFDLYFPIYISNHFHKNGYIKFSNPDFIRTVTAEASGENPENIFMLKEENIENKLNLLHFTGSAALQSFLPFITKLSAFPTQFPLKLICSGKEYHNNNQNFVQSTCNRVFVATKDELTFDEIINEQINYFMQIYEPFNQHFRIVAYPAFELSSIESFKIGVEIYSKPQQKFIQVGNFSYFNNTISKRLLFNYKIGKEFEFPHIYSGTIVNCMPLLSTLLENKVDLKNFVASYRK